MTQETKQKAAHWWESYGFLVKGFGKFSGRIIIGLVTGSFAAGQVYTNLKKDWVDGKLADIRHDSVAVVTNHRIDTIERYYVSRDELKASAFKVDNTRREIR